MRFQFTIRDLLLVTVIIALGLQFPLQHPAIADDSPVTLDTIINAWKAREEKIETFDFRWWSKHFESADLENRGGDDAEFIRPCRLVGDAKGRLRFEAKGREWDREANEYVNRMRIEVFDGVHSITFTQDRDLTYPDLTYPQATIRDKGISMTSGVLPTVSFKLETVPVIIAFRATKIHHAYTNYQNLEFNEDTGLGTSGRGNHSKVDFDSAKDFMPTRLMMPFNRGQKQVEIDYARDETAGWVPHSWKYSFTNATGKQIASDEATVMQYSINKPVEENEFKLDYPDGTVFNTVQQMYILRADGRRQRVVPGTVSRETYQRLLDSEPDEK